MCVGSAWLDPVVPHARTVPGALPHPHEARTDVKVLIVESNPDLGRIWARFLERRGLICRLAAAEDDALTALRTDCFDAIVLDMEMPRGGALAVSDFAAYRYPDIPIIAVSARGFFSDGAIFELIPNARSLLRTPLRPDDMAALVEHYGGRYAAIERDRASGA